MRVDIVYIEKTDAPEVVECDSVYETKDSFVLTKKTEDGKRIKTWINKNHVVCLSYVREVEKA